MATFIESITNRSTALALEHTLSFQQARLQTIAENVANAHTPGFRARQLDTRGFKTGLRKAIESRGRRTDAPLEVSSGREVSTAANGRLRVSPSQKPVDNTLFQDGTNLSIEREMADLAQTGLEYDVAAALLGRQWDGLRKAIRGTI